jgi:hypothetical protein
MYCEPVIMSLENVHISRELVSRSWEFPNVSIGLLVRSDRLLLYPDIL